ncbi:hypothetical protein CROQUDRAFT_130048 [Cronartium quercuum f. sp. fusiforme G11]|uniref:Uncharacterized protein n=1 Tax=Cronartium quercuum f. sp. fusiforme G11 TaxID=708437 RepID=A0A9P6TGD2_9BASI|nr:hypothetical protein CROQUDRAFT_130048 [Cronartium quercuum f. sp. fusiforme G11]
MAFNQTIPNPTSPDRSTFASISSSLPDPITHIERRHVTFYPIVRLIHAHDDLSNSCPSSMTHSHHDSRKGRMRIAKKTLSLSFSLTFHHRPMSSHFSISSPTLTADCNSRHATLERTRLEIEEDEQFIPSTPRELKITIPSITRRRSRKAIRMEEEERMRRWREATGGKLKSSLKVATSPNKTAPASNVGLDKTNIGLFGTPQPDHLTPDVTTPPHNSHANQIVDETRRMSMLSDPHPTVSQPVPIVAHVRPLPASDDSDNDEASSPEQGAKVQKRAFVRLAKKISDSGLNLRIFTPKPIRNKSLSQTSLVGCAPVDESEEVGESELKVDRMSSSSPRTWVPSFSPCRNRSTNVDQRTNVPMTSSLEVMSTPDLSGRLMTDGPDSRRSADNLILNRLPVRSNSYHLDPRARSQTTDEPYFNTDPYGPTTKIRFSVSKPQLDGDQDQRLTRYERELRPCCKDCWEATSKALDPEYEINFSPRALQLYRSRVGQNIETSTDEQKHDLIGSLPIQPTLLHDKTVICDWARLKQNSLTKKRREPNLIKSIEPIPVLPISNSSNLTSNVVKITSSQKLITLTV